MLTQLAQAAGCATRRTPLAVLLIVVLVALPQQAVAPDPHPGGVLNLVPGDQPGLGHHVADAVVAGVLHATAGRGSGGAPATATAAKPVSSRRVEQPAEGRLQRQVTHPDATAASQAALVGNDNQQQQQAAGVQQREQVPDGSGSGGGGQHDTITGHDLVTIRDEHYRQYEKGGNSKPRAPARAPARARSSGHAATEQQQAAIQRDDATLLTEEELQAALNEAATVTHDNGLQAGDTGSDEAFLRDAIIDADMHLATGNKQAEAREANARLRAVEGAIVGPGTRELRAEAEVAEEARKARRRAELLGQEARERASALLRAGAEQQREAEDKELTASAAAGRRAGGGPDGRAAQQRRQPKPKQLVARQDAFAKDVKARLLCMRTGDCQGGKSTLQKPAASDTEKAHRRRELGAGATGALAGGAALRASNHAHGQQLSELFHEDPAPAVQRRRSPRAGTDISLASVLPMMLAMAGAAGLGALPLFFVRELSPALAGTATAVACGVMFAASFDLIHEGQSYGPMLVVLGVVLGGIFIKWSQEWLSAREDLHFNSLSGNAARRAMLMVGIMAAHALGEGCGVGVSFVGNRGWAQGVLTTLAIGVHNIPEGLAKATVLVGQGLSPSQALLWSVATCLPQPLVAVPAFLFVETFKALLPVALGFAAGCMIWLVFGELLPEALSSTSPSSVATAATLAAAGLEGCRMFFESLEQPDGSLAWGVLPLAGDLSQLLPAAGVALPAVAVTAVVGAAAARVAAGLPAAGLGIAAGLAGTAGSTALLRQLLFAAHVPVLHTAGCALLGAGGVELLRRQLLSSLSSSKDGGSNLDLAAAEEANRQQHSASAEEPAGLDSAYRRQVAAAAAAVRNGSLPGSPSNGRQQSCNHGSASKSRRGGLSRPVVATAGWAGIAALAVAAGSLGLLLGKSMLALASDMSNLILPASLALAVRGAAAGAIAACLARHATAGAGSNGGVYSSLGSIGAIGAAAGGAVAGLCGAVALVVVAATPELAHEEVVLSRFDYPRGLNDSLAALVAGALCAAAALLLTSATGGRYRRAARGGAAVGACVAAAASGLAQLLCMLTPYCWSY